MFRLFIDYTTWHYTHAVVNIFKLTKEFVRFFLNLFSMSLFLRTLFSPLFSIPVDDVGRNDISDVIAVFVGGVILRILGAFFRLCLIALGLLLSIFTITFFSIVFVLWFTMPAVFIVGVYYLIGTIFTTI